MLGFHGTAVRDDSGGRVSLSEACDGRQANHVRLGADELRQVMSDQLSFLHVPLHGDVLLPPALLPRLDETHISCNAEIIRFETKT